MKKVVRCPKCANCAVGYETGFAGGELLYCHRTGEFVESEDGCTKGSAGKPSTLRLDYDIDVSPHAAVWGCE